MRNNTPIVVDVCMDTYNHEPFIAEAIDSVLMQQTCFPFRIVIGEDCSTDATRKICEIYASEFPEKILLLPSTRNLGQNHNKYRTMMACTAKYIALCEGDDFWTDPLKLQKQVMFMENNPNYVMCFHRANTVDRDGNILERNSGVFQVKTFRPAEMVHVFVPTMSLVYRNCIDEFPPEYFIAKSTDAFLVGMLSQFGLGADLGFAGASYRKHEGGLYNSLPLVKRYGQSLITRRLMAKSSFFSPELKREIKKELCRRYQMYTKGFVKKGDIINLVRMNFLFLFNL